MQLKKGIYNVLFGGISQIITVIVGLLIPKLLVESYGSEVNGLLSSINQLLTYMILFEAGVGTVTQQALYKPLSEQKNEDVNAVLSATQKYYNRTGVMYGIVLCVGAVMYSLLVSTHLSTILVIGVIIISGLGSVLNYWVYGKLRILLQADGHSYIVNNIITLAYVLTSLGRVYLIYHNYNIFIVQIMQFAFYFLQMMLITFFAKKKYPWINTKVSPNLEAIGQKNSVFVHQISSLIFSNTDILVLTLFCGLTMVSIYSMYNLLFSTLLTAITTIVASLIYILGKKYHSDREEYYIYYDFFEVCYIGGGFAIFSVLYICVIPFMRLYTKNFSDASYINYFIPILFLVIQLLNIMRGASNNLINIAGHFKKTQNRALIEMSINIIVSLIGVWFYGIYGVLIGTIVALLYRTNDMIVYANHRILDRSAFHTYKTCVVNLIICIAIVIYYWQYRFLNMTSYLDLVLFCIKHGVVILVIYLVLNTIFEMNVIKKLVQKCGRK